MNEAPVFTIAGELSIYRAAELCQALQAWLPQALACGNDTVQLDLAEVSEIDTAGLQLLLAVQRSAKDAGTQLTLQSASPTVMEVLQLTALEHLIAPAAATAP